MNENPTPNPDDQPDTLTALQKVLQDQVDYAKQELAGHKPTMQMAHDAHEQAHKALLDAVERQGYLNAMIDRAKEAAIEAGVTLDI